MLDDFSCFCCHLLTLFSINVQFEYSRTPDLDFRCFYPCEKMMYSQMNDTTHTNICTFISPPYGILDFQKTYNLFFYCPREHKSVKAFLLLRPKGNNVLILVASQIYFGSAG